MVRVAIVMAVWSAVALASCRRGSNEPRIARRDQPNVTHVVARVGALAIGASEIENRMATDEVDADAALEQLIDEAALVQEAERAGFTENRDDERSIERLMVRTMLRDLEKENTPESISEEDVREVYEVNASEFQVPERRRSSHILVESQSEDAEALAESILREMQRADDPRSVYDRYAHGEPADVSLKLRAEELPAIIRSANLENSYKDALFGAKSEGPLKKAVKTSYGWHAIVVTEILPEEMRTLEDAESEIRDQLSQSRRLGAIVAIVQGLEAQGLVQRNEPGVQRLLSMPGLPERAE